MNKLGVLLISNNKSLAELLVKYLSENNIKCIHATEENFLNQAQSKQPDIFLVDDELEQIDSLFVCKRLSKKFPYIPQILVTSKKDVGYINKYLKAGVKDFEAKPVNPETLLLRINKNTKKSTSVRDSLENGDLFVKGKKKKILYKQQEIKFTPKEYRLVRYFIQNRGKVLSRNKILNHVWGFDTHVIDRNVDVYVGYVRKKLDKVAGKKFIKTIPSFGYMMINYD
ncbi:response regulator [Candidatus Dojkabacteria bacterium]|nr:response regulator [Candidatus Dojkabacteria bacterium]